MVSAMSRGLKSENLLWTATRFNKLADLIHTEWWIPAGELEELNDSIVGLIDVIGEYRKDS